jgi:uncharacterized membrane protein YdjX (TVP38/TMEM64 family)
MRRYLAGAAAAVVVALAVLLRPASALDVLRTALASPWFPAILVGLYAARPFLAWPISLLSALVGFKYGLLVGVPVALAGALLTSIPAYAVGRYAPADGRLFGRFSDGSQRFFAATGDVRGLVAARFAPTPAEPVSAAAGAGGVSPRSFTAGTLVGELPWVVATVALGSGLDTFAMAASSVDPVFLAVGVLAAAVLLGPVAYRELAA